MDIHADIYDEFRCIGGDCRRNCCQGWAITIDPKTSEYYRSLDDEFGKMINSRLDFLGDGSSKFALKKGEKCPAQREDGLCDIFCRYGEDKLSKTCTRFPRYNVEVYGNNEFRYLSNECEEVLRILYDREANLNLIIEAKDKKDLNENATVNDFAQLVAWCTDTIQDESIPLWNALITVMHICIEASKPFVDVDMEKYQKVIESIPSVSNSYNRAIGEIPADMLYGLAWERIKLISVAYLDFLNLTDFKVYTEMFPSKEKYSASVPNRGEQIKEQFERFVSKTNQKDARFYRRYIANLFLTFCFDLLFDDANEKMLSEYGVKVIVSLTVPPLWDDEALTDRDEFFSRFAMLQRMSKTNYMSHLSKPIKEQMNPGLTDYALMFAGLFSGLPGL